MKLKLLDIEEVHYTPGVVITAGMYVLMDKDQRVYLRTTSQKTAEDKKAELNARYPHMGFIVEYHAQTT